MRSWILAGASAALLAAGGCTAVTVQHKVDPIFITVDVNIRVQKELERVFDFEPARGELVDAGNTDGERPQ